MPFRRKALGAGIAVLMLAGTSTAYAAEITASTTGASATTTENRARAKVTDTAADSRRADADYRRGNASATIQTISATGGNGSSATSPSGTTIATLRACIRDSNPLTSNVCSVWKTL